MSNGFNEEDVRLATLYSELKQIKESADGMYSVADFADSVTFDGKADTSSSNSGFSSNLAYSQALQRPSATACAYINEQQLRMIRAASRAFCVLNPYWKAVRENKIAYAVGTGHVLSVVSRRNGKKVPAELSWKVADELEQFSKLNQYRRRQGEKLTRLDRDGEYFLRYIADKDDGILRVRFVEPLLIQDPPGKGPQTNVWFGVQFDGIDYEEPLGYYIRPATYDGGLSGELSELWATMVPAEEIQHVTVNVDLGSPRGLPSTYDLQDQLKQAISTLKSMGRLVDIRARIALIRKQVNATLNQIQPLLLRNRSSQAQGSGGQMRNVFGFPYGAVVDTNDQRNYEFPSQNIETDKIVHSLKADLQGVASAMGLADFTISGDSSCHDTETELMTKRGWLRHDQLAYGDVAGTVNPATGAFEWQEVQQIHRSQYDGEMVRFKNDETLDMMVTPNHRMYASVRHSTRVNGVKMALPRKPWDFVLAGDFVAQTALPNHCKPKGGIATECFIIPGVEYGQGLPLHKHMRDQTQRILIRTRKDKTVPMEPWLSFLGWFISEGWTNISKDRHQNTIAISQNKKASSECDLIRESVAGLGGYTVHENSICNTTKTPNGNEYVSDMWKWTIHDKSLCAWLRENCGVGSYRKQLPVFVHDLPAGQQEVLLESAVMGDGSHMKTGTRMYYTMSRRLADDMQMLAVQCGHAANLHKQTASGKFTLAIGRRRKTVSVKKEHMSRVPYSGTVWCVTVPNGIIITRRNGKMAISGNSAFANSLIKEGPMDRAIGRLQQDLIDQDTEVYERALTVAASHGRLPEDVLETVRIDLMPPGVIARERLTNTQADQILWQCGAISSDTMAMRANLDPEDEKEKGAEPKVSTGDSNPNQPGKAKSTTRGVPASEEPGVQANRNATKESIEEAACPTTEDFAMASLVLTDPWCSDTKAQIMALPVTGGVPRDIGVRSEYEPGIAGVYLGVVDGQRVWAIDPLAMQVKHGIDEFVAAGNHLHWPWLSAESIVVDWGKQTSDIWSTLYHECAETKLMSDGHWAYARAHRMAGYLGREWATQIRPELQPLAPKD